MLIQEIARLLDSVLFMAGGAWLLLGGRDKEAGEPAVTFEAAAARKKKLQAMRTSGVILLSLGSVRFLWQMLS